MSDLPAEVVGITLTVQTATPTPEAIARTIEVIARTAAGLALETGLDINISIVRFDPDQEDAQP